MYRLRRMQQALPFRRGRGGKHAPGRGDLRRIVCDKGRLLKNRTAAERAGIKRLFVPADNAPEAAFASGLEVYLSGYTAVL